MNPLPSGSTDRAGLTAPPILILSHDRSVLPGLQDAARSAGLTPVIVEAPSDLAAQGDPLGRPVPATEPLEGSDARFVRALVDLQPALIVVDLDSRHLPWERWIQVLSTSAATRRLPVLAFGRRPAALRRALELGASAAARRAGFLRDLATPLRSLARRDDPSALAAACTGVPDPRAIEGVRRLAAGDYFAAHESLEAAVLGTPGLEAGLYRVLLHVAVTYLHLERGNRRGAIKMLLRLRGWLHPLPDSCRGIDLAGLRLQIAALQAALDAGHDPAAIRAAGLLRPIPMLESGVPKT